MQLIYRKNLLILLILMLCCMGNLRANQGLRSIIKVISATGGLTTVIHYICEYNEAKDSLQLVKTTLSELEQYKVPPEEINTIALQSGKDKQLLSQLLIGQKLIGQSKTGISIPVSQLKGSSLVQVKPISNQALLKDYTIGKPIPYAAIVSQPTTWWSVAKGFLLSKTGITLIVLIVLGLWLRS